MAKNWERNGVQKRDEQHVKGDLELPQSIIDSFARFLLPEIRKYYNSEQGQKEFEAWKQTSERKNEDQGPSP